MSRRNPTLKFPKDYAVLHLVEELSSSLKGREEFWSSDRLYLICVKMTRLCDIFCWVALLLLTLSQTFPTMFNPRKSEKESRQMCLNVQWINNWKHYLVHEHDDESCTIFTGKCGRNYTGRLSEIKIKISLSRETCTRRWHRIVVQQLTQNRENKLIRKLIKENCHIWGVVDSTSNTRDRKTDKN